MTPLYGRSFRGERLLSGRPTAKGERISIIGALDRDGLLDCMCFNGALNGTVFFYYVEHFSATHLSPGKNVISDNASPHKNEDALNFIEESGSKVLCSPPYYPDLNPIEFCRSKVKTFLRKLNIRTSKELYKGYADSLKLIDSKMAAACFRHCGL